MLFIKYNTRFLLRLSCIVVERLSTVAMLLRKLGVRLLLGRAPVGGMACGVVLAGLLLGGGPPMPSIAVAQPAAADALMESSLVAQRVLDSSAEATFTMIQKGGEERVRTSTGFTKLQSDGVGMMRIVRFTAPADINGTSVLLVEHTDAADDMWIYLPALRRVRRLNAANKRDSFVGTDFSYGDVISHKTADWKHRLLRDEPLDGAECYVVESVPASDEIAANSGYSRRLSWIRKDIRVATRVDFWDLAGQPLKRITASDIKQVGSRGKWQSMVSEAQNLQTGHRTIIHLRRYAAEQNLPDSLFSPRELDR